MNAKQLNPLDLTLTISLSEADEDRMQLVYASQLYQTFFAVFGAFDVDRTDPNDLKLKGIVLQLINYKGMINLGIIGVSNPIIIENGIEIRFKVKAMMPSGILKYYGFDEAVPVKNSDRIDFQRVLEPIDVKPYTGVGDNLVHDCEFFERDGLYNRKRTLRLDDDNVKGFISHDSDGELRRWLSTPATLERNDARMANTIKYHSGILIIPHKQVIPKAPGGRCPKSKSIAKY
ncbi:hypothetical protein [Aquimarina sp. Aq78]|uniref:hypothetical protein n=1 Tax=Aquimarina sp. Aq78 TaxID=1191889 RepID=UPI000D104AF0|nr:hypothetical protein [Aquimarina sp. Aq78]